MLLLFYSGEPVRWVSPWSENTEVAGRVGALVQSASEFQKCYLYNLKTRHQRFMTRIKNTFPKCVTWCYTSLYTYTPDIWSISCHSTHRKLPHSDRGYETITWSRCQDLPSLVVSLLLWCSRQICPSMIPHEQTPPLSFCTKVHCKRAQTWLYLQVTNILWV